MVSGRRTGARGNIGGSPVVTRRRFAALGAAGLAGVGLAARALPGLAGTAGDEGGDAAANVRPRIASLDWALAETLVALGSPPVAVPDKRGYSEWVVEPPLPASTADLGSRFTPNIELLAALAPDLVVAIPYQGPLLPVVERVAPTLTLSIYEPDGRPFERACEVATRLAAAAARPAAATALVARAEAAFAAARARIAHLPRRPVLVVSLVDPHHAWVYGAGSLFAAVIERLGLANAWHGETNSWGFSAVGLEGLAAADPDARLVLLEPVPPDVAARLATNPLWQRLPFVRGGEAAIRLPVVVFGGLPSAIRFSDLLSARLAEAPA